MTLPTGRQRIGDGWQGAFTLLELIVVLMLLTVVFTVSAPSLGQFFKSRSLVEEARRMLALTEHARREAISTGAPMQLLFDMSRDVLYVQREDGYQPGQLGNRTVQTTRPYWISEKHEIIFEIGEPIEQDLYVVTFLPDGSLLETSPTSWRLQNRENSEEFYRVAKLQGQLRYLLLRDDDPKNEYIQIPATDTVEGGVYLR